MKTHLIILLLFTGVFSGCYIPPEKPKVKVYTERDTLVVVAKRIEHKEAGIFSSSRDKYLLALSNKDTEECSYAEYECLSIGDSIYRHKLNTELYWQVDFDCNYNIKY